VALIAAGPRSSSPRGRRALSFWGFLGFSAILVRNASGGRWYQPSGAAATAVRVTSARKKTL
jgi:hypothetical protein